MSHWLSEWQDHLLSCLGQLKSVTFLLIPTPHPYPWSVGTPLESHDIFWLSTELSAGGGKRNFENTTKLYSDLTIQSRPCRLWLSKTNKHSDTSKDDPKIAQISEYSFRDWGRFNFLCIWLLLLTVLWKRWNFNHTCPFFVGVCKIVLEPCKRTWI